MSQKNAIICNQLETLQKLIEDHLDNVLEGCDKKTLVDGIMPWVNLGNQIQQAVFSVEGAIDVSRKVNHLLSLIFTTTNYLKSLISAPLDESELIRMRYDIMVAIRDLLDLLDDSDPYSFNPDQQYIPPEVNSFTPLYQNNSNYHNQNNSVNSLNHSQNNSVNSFPDNQQYNYQHNQTSNSQTNQNLNQEVVESTRLEKLKSEERNSFLSRPSKDRTKMSPSSSGSFQSSNIKFLDMTRRASYDNSDDISSGGASPRYESPSGVQTDEVEKPIVFENKPLEKLDIPQPRTERRGTLWNQPDTQFSKDREAAAKAKEAAKQLEMKENAVKEESINGDNVQSTTSKFLPSFLELKSRADDPELEFIKSVSQIAKNYMGDEWDKNNKEDILAFEQAIHLVISKYKDVANEKNEKSSSSGLEKKPLGAGSSKKFDMSGISALQRAVSKQQGGKALNKSSKMNTYFLSNEFQDNGTPRSRIVAKLMDNCSILLNSLVSHISPFSKNGISSSAIDSLVKDTGELGKYHSSLANQIVTISSEILAMVPPIANPDGAMGKISKRCTDNIRIGQGNWSELIPLDTKLFTQGQYIKSIILALVEAIIKEMQSFENSCLRLFSVLKGLNQQDPCCFLQLLAHLQYFLTVMRELLQDFSTLIFICKRSEASFQQEIPQSDGSIAKEPPDTDPDKFRAGTINSLIVRITQPGSEELIPIFWTGFEFFSKPYEIFDKLKTRYKSSGNDIKSQVAEVLLHWVDHEVYTIDIPTLKEIEKFSNENLKKNEFTNAFTSLVNKISVNKFVVRNTLNDNFNVKSLWLSQLPPYSVFLAAEPKVIAEQLTRIGSEAYNRITPSELINLKWSKDKLKVLSRNVVDMISQPNMLSHFVATSILLQRKKMDRTRMITQIILIGKQLLELNNFNGLMGVLAGLCMSPITRLKHSWAKLTEQTKEVHTQITAIQDPSAGSKKLREAMGQSSQALPYIGLSLTDLTFMDEGNPTFLDPEKKMINFPKYQMINRCIKLLLQFQGSSFFNTIVPSQPIYAFLSEMSNLNENELWELSQEREPKGCAYKDIE